MAAAIGSRGKMRSPLPQMAGGTSLVFCQIAGAAIRFAASGGAAVQNVTGLQHFARGVDRTSEGNVVPFIIAARKRDL